MVDVPRPRIRLARTPIWLMVVVMGALLTWSITYGATRPQNGRPAPPPLVAANGPSPSSSPSPLLPTATPTPAPAIKLPELDKAIHAIESTRKVSLGVAISPLSPVGRPTTYPYEGGTLRTGEAWSTIDVVLALAVVRESKQPEDLDYLLTRAIVESSPAGDDALWAFLGNDAAAAQKTVNILRSAGDNSTVVPEGRTRPQYSPYSQTLWSNAAQSQFAAALYCMEDSWPILTRMDDEPVARKWGLSALPRTQSRSGSGPQTNGTILVRQFGAVTLQDGTRVGIGLAAVAVDGTEETAITALDELVAKVYSLAHGFRAGSC